MRRAVLTTSAVVLSLTAALAAAGAANAADPTCTVGLTLPSRFVLDAKNDENGHFSFVMTRTESTPGCYTDHYDSDDYPHSIRLEGYPDYVATTNYLGDGQWKRTDWFPGGSDATYVQAVGSSRSNDGDDDPGYLAPDSARMDVRGRGYASLKVAVQKRQRVVSVSVRRYSHAAGEVVAWERARVQIQQQRGDQWITVKSARANAKGVATVKVKGKHTFRAVVADSDIAWGTTSRSVTK